jgi:hypothetical protein
MDIHYSLLGVDKDTSIEDIKKAFRVNTLKNDMDFDTLQNAYNNILTNKESFNMEVKSQKLDNMNNFMMHQPFIQPCMITPNLFKMNASSNKVESNPLENMLSIIFGNKSDDNEENIETVLHEIAHKMFDLKGGLHKLHEIGEEQNDPIIICKNLSISLMDIYNNINIGDILDIECLRYLNIFEIKFNEVNTYNVKVNKSKYIYKITVNVENDQNFRLVNNELHYTMNISLLEALCGFSKSINHLNGKTYTIKNSTKIINPGSSIELKNLGFKNNDDIGSLFVSFNINFPTDLSQESKDGLMNILN